MQRLFHFILFVVAAFTVRAAEVVSDSVAAIMLEGLDVVAVKSNASLQEMAVSGNLITSAAIDLNNISDIRRISDLVPNFFVPEYGSRITSSIYVRGIGARMDQPAVGLNIDNLPVLNKDAYDLDIPDIAEIEMLRGPQSSLYGRNTMTGVINIRTLSPMKWQGWRAMAQIASGTEFKLQAGWYHKFNSSSALSVNIGGLSSQGRFRNLYNGKKIDKERSAYARMRFEWQPSPTLMLSNSLSTSILRQGGYPYEFVPTGEINYNDTCFYRRFLLNDALTMRFNFRGWSLTSVTTVQHLDDNMTLDQDFLPLPYFTLTQKKRETAITEEAIFRWTPSDKYNFLGGVFAFYRHLNMDAPVHFGDEGIRSLIENHRNSSNPFYPIAWDTRKFALNSDFRMPSFGLAVFHESRLNLGNFRLIAAIRLDYEKVSMDFKSFATTGYTILNNPSGLLPHPDNLTPFHHIDIDLNESGSLSNDFLTLLPKVSVLYTLPDNIGNVYATFGKGYKAGGFNTQMFSDVLQQRLMNQMGIGSKYEVSDIVAYKPEYSFNYEIGGHFSPLSCLEADLSFFYIDCRNQQLTMFPDGNTTGRIMTNAGKTRSMGWELSLRYTPAKWVELIAGWGFTNAKFVSFFDGKADYSGKKVPYAPANTLSVQPVFTITSHSLGNNKVVIDTALNGNGRIYWNEANSLSQPFYLTLNMGVAFRAPTWEIRAWGRNISDTRYSTFYFMSMGNEFLQRAPGASFGITARWWLEN